MVDEQYGNLCFDDAGRLLVRDRVVVREIETCFGRAAPSIIAELKSQPLSDVDPDLFDFLSDVLHNEARCYLTYESAAAEEGDTYSIEVMGLGGVYFVRANEFDPIGYFDSLSSAESAIYDRWGDGVLVWFDNKAPRLRPFGPRCKDAVGPVRRKSVKTRTARREG